MVFDHKNSLVNITVLLVDDDPTVLSIVSTMLKASKYRDSSIMEITVTTVKNSMEALSTLRIQRDSIDLVITDYHMPGMNGLELTKIIDQEFGKLPVVVMSSDNNSEIEQETITSGGLCFITKPVKPNDLNTIWQYALRSKKKGKSISTDEYGDNGGDDGDDDNDNDNNNNNNNNNNKNVVASQSCKELVGRKDRGSTSSDKQKGWVRKPYSGSCSRNADDNTDVSGKDRKRKPKDNMDEDDDDDDDEDDDADSRPSAPKKAKVVWTNSLHNLFLQAIRHIGLDKAVPKKILEFMSVPGLTRENIASHLQKYRIFLKKVAERGVIQSGLLSNRAMNSNFAYGHINSPHPYYNHTVPSTYGTTLSHRPYNLEPGFGHGQSRLLMNNNNNSITHNPCLYSHLNRSSYESNRIQSTSSLSTRGNFAFSNATTTQAPTVLPQNEERRGLLYMGINPGRNGQTSQFQGIGSQYGTSNSSGMNLTTNPDPNPRNYNGTAYAGIRMNDRGDLIGLGPVQVNGNGYANSLGRGLGYMNWNLNNNSNGHGSSSTHHHHLHQGFGHLSTQQPSSFSSSSAHLFTQALQPFLSNGASVDRGQSQGIIPNGQVDFAFPELDKLSNLYSQNQLGGEYHLPDFPYDASNSRFDHNQKQGEESSQNPEPEEFPFEMNKLLETMSIEDNAGWNYENTSQGGSNGETLNSAVASTEMYSPLLDNNPDPNQEQSGGDFIELPYFNQDWGDDDFMDSLFDYGMH